MSVTRDWQPTDLAAVLDGLRTGAIVGPIPALMPRTDGVCLLYPNEVHSIAGEPEVGKGWIVQGETARILPHQKVLYLDFEDTAASVLGRLLALGTTAEQIAANLVYVRPDTPPVAQTIPRLLRLGPFALAVIDGLSEAYVLLGLDPYSNVDAAKFLAAIARPIADAGAAVTELDHVTKATESRGRYAIGAQHKLAGIAVAYSVEAIKPPNRLAAGMLKVKVTKDRHGHVRGHADSGGTIALVHVTPSDEGEHVTITVAPPDGTADEFRPTFLMERISHYLNTNPGATANDIKGDVKGNTRAKQTGLRILIAEGYVEPRPDGQARRHHNLRNFAADNPETDDRDHRDQTGTKPGPSPSQNHRDHRDHPLQGGSGPGPGSTARRNGQPGPGPTTDPLDAELARVTGKFGEGNS